METVSNLTSNKIKLDVVRQSLTRVYDELKYLNQKISTRSQIVNKIKTAEKDSTDVKLNGKTIRKSNATSTSKDFYSPTVIEAQPQQKSGDKQPDDDINDFFLQVDASADYFHSSDDVENLFQWSGFNYILDRQIIFKKTFKYQKYKIHCINIWSIDIKLKLLCWLPLGSLCDLQNIILAMMI